MSPQQSRELGCRPSAPFGWKSLVRVAQPLTFPVTEPAPPSDSRRPPADHDAARARRPLPHRRLTHSVRTALAMPGLGAPPLTVRNASSRTRSSRFPCRPNATDGWFHSISCVRTPFRPTYSATPRQRRLGSHRAGPARPPNLAARATTGPRCFRPTRALHVFKDEHPIRVWLSAHSMSLPKRPWASRLGSHFRRSI